MKTLQFNFSIMKKISMHLLLLTSILLFTVSCEDQESSINTSSLYKEIPETIELKDFYLVEGDLLIPKSDSKLNGRTEQANTNNLLNYTLQPSIRVHTEFWTQEVIQALNDWTNITNCRLSFTFVTTVQNADISIVSDGGSLPSNTIAAATFPSNGRAGNLIRLNLDFNNGSIPSSQKRYNLVHELGHCLGLRHTNWAARGESTGSDGANTIPGTPTTDANSVMNGGTADFSWNGLSTNDILAVQTLYSQNNPITNGLISPNGGESMRGRTQGGGSAIFTMTIVINTQVFNASQVAVDLLQGDRVFYYGVRDVVNGKVIFGSVFPGGGQNVYKIKITDINNPNTFDVSDATFTITGVQ